MELTLPREVLVSILSADPKAWCSLRKNSSIAPWKDLVISSDTTCYAQCDEAMHSKTERHASRGPIAIKLLGRRTRRRWPNNSLEKAPITAHNLSKSKASTVSSLSEGVTKMGHSICIEVRWSTWYVCTVSIRIYSVDTKMFCSTHL